MVLHSKAPAKKQQNKRIAFKKIKRKLGRKLPKIQKSKEMILPEQSVAAEKRKGLTLNDLLQQTSHCNAKLRKDIESRDHLFLICAFSQAIWRLVFLKLDPNRSLLLSWSELLSWRQATCQTFLPYEGKSQPIQSSMKPHDDAYEAQTLKLPLFLRDEETRKLPVRRGGRNLTSLLETTPKNGDGEAPKNGDGKAPKNGDGEAPKNGDGKAPKNGDGKTGNHR
ncbi:predicted protein [Arabidopsis lyrata subsp. lyrata]|uniref:Predicted protein n=1 Tax=Arabidopsis lyrata subsp. lyrata TaxID=81972 RepID=D7M1S8_ARALL|nr:predicted protein [Arabidopsis lyrata subsp. lyrata]